MDELVDIGPEAFTDGYTINYKGQNYYPACDAFVSDLADGGQSFCVKRAEHHGSVHESFDGTIRED